MAFKFQNASSSALDATFQLAVDAGAVVTSFAVLVGATVLRSKLVRRGEADSLYKAALSRGAAAQLTESKCVVLTMVAPLVLVLVLPVFVRCERHCVTVNPIRVGRESLDIFSGKGKRAGKHAGRTLLPLFCHCKGLPRDCVSGTFTRIVRGAGAVGNIPPRTSVEVFVEYLAEAQIVHKVLRFCWPSCVPSRVLTSADGTLASSAWTMDLQLQVRCSINE
jgi:hypothetical protein